MDQKQTKELYDTTIRLCCDIEKEMATTVDPTNPAEVEEQLSNLIPWLANLPKLKGDTLEIYSEAKGKATEEILLRPNLLEAKQDIQKKWMESRLGKEDALYERVESLEKNLRMSIEGLRTILSYEKERMYANRNASGGTK